MTHLRVLPPLDIVAPASPALLNDWRHARPGTRATAKERPRVNGAPLRPTEVGGEVSDLVLRRSAACASMPDGLCRQQMADIDRRLRLHERQEHAARVHVLGSAMPPASRMAPS